MLKKLLISVVYGNFFVAFCVVALCVEASLQQEKPLNSLWFYLLIFSCSVIFYTIAYPGNIPPNTSNKRLQWYYQNKVFVKGTQVICIMASIACVAVLAAKHLHAVKAFRLWEYMLAGVFPVVAFLYYGFPVLPGLNVNLRETGWMKPFVIGFVWSGVVTIYPLLFHQIETGNVYSPSFITLWLFVKNWMFVAVLCIMFDIKDYAADYNRHIKTFVVQAGLRRTIYFILIPLIITGFVSYIIFATFQHFPWPVIAVNSIPFMLLLVVAYTLQWKKAILYYLTVIDGLMLVKALCGTMGILFLR